MVAGAVERTAVGVGEQPGEGNWGADSSCEVACLPEATWGHRSYTWATETRLEPVLQAPAPPHSFPGVSLGVHEDASARWSQGRDVEV